jgi:non-specific serine/threonine protein kinase
VQQALGQTGVVELVRGNAEDAAGALRQADALAAAHGEQWHRSYVLWTLGLLHADQGRTDLAWALLCQSLALKQAFHDGRGSATTLETMAWAAAEQGEGRSAARLFGAAHSAWPSASRRLFGFRELVLRGEYYRERVRAELGDEDFTRHFTRQPVHVTARCGDVRGGHHG